MFQTYFKLRELDFQNNILTTNQLNQYKELHKYWMKIIIETGSDIMRSKYIHAHFSHYLQLHKRAATWGITPKQLTNEGWEASNKSLIFTYQRHSSTNGGGGRKPKGYLSIKKQALYIDNSIFPDILRKNNNINNNSDNFEEYDNELLREEDQLIITNTNFNLLSKIIHPLLLPISIDSLNFENENLIQSPTEQLERFQFFNSLGIKELSELTKYYHLKIINRNKANYILELLNWEQKEIIRLQYRKISIENHIHGVDFLVTIYLAQLVQHLQVFEDYQLQFHNSNTNFYQNRISKVVIPTIIQNWYNSIDIDNLFTFSSNLSENLLQKKILRRKPH